MQAAEVPGAVAAGMSTASMLDLTADDAIVLHDSNKLILHLLPCDVLARVAPVAHQAAQLEIELAHAGMQPPKRIGVVGRWDRSRCHGLVVGPQRDHKAITLIDPWRHSRLKSRHRAPGFREPLSKLDFELCDLMRYRCHLGKDVIGQQTHSQLVRVVKHDRVVNCHVS